ncbi:MAG TPA: hypothetical protein VMM83_07775 [Longimicrobiales bacterium]|nr:hypothetical protein [Longimicrobiales bacterium]
MVLLIALGSADAAGQDGVDCTFDACALRVEHRFNGLRVVRGLEAQPVATLGLFGNSLAEVVASSDSAFAYALESDRQKRASTAWGIFSLVASAAAAWDFTTGFWERDPGAVMYAGFGIGLGAAMVSGWQATRSLDSVEKAVWWYNRDLSSRDPVGESPRKLKGGKR